MILTAYFSLYSLKFYSTMLCCKHLLFIVVDTNQCFWSLNPDISVLGVLLFLSLWFPFFQSLLCFWDSIIWLFQFWIKLLKFYLFSIWLLVIPSGTFPHFIFWPFYLVLFLIVYFYFLRIFIIWIPFFHFNVVFSVLFCRHNFYLFLYFYLLKAIDYKASFSSFFIALILLHHLCFVLSISS